jgi:hypothetical protein
MVNRVTASFLELRSTEVKPLNAKMKKRPANKGVHEQLEDILWTLDSKALPYHSDISPTTGPRQGKNS